MDPFTTNLVVADPDREKGTICLAITPALKALGVRNRCRVYEIPETIPYYIAPPRMQLYIEYSTAIYGIYLKYVSSEDVHVYSVDEAFLDVTKYMSLYQKSAKEICMMIMEDIKQATGITASGGIGTNLYLAKIALDITAKHAKDHIGILTEETYRRTLWHHLPLTDFWRIGPGTVKRLFQFGIITMEDIARCDEDILYRIFGIDAELLIDHAWGRETTQMRDIKRYTPKTHSVSNGQVLLRNYNYEEAEIIVKEMTELLCLDMVERKVISNSFTLYIGYSHQFPVPSSGGTVNTFTATNSSRAIRLQLVKLYRQIVNRTVPIRRINIWANQTKSEACQQYNLFVSPEEMERERHLQMMMIEIKRRFGKNAILKGMNLEKAGTTIARNQQIGGHKSWG